MIKQNKDIEKIISALCGLGKITPYSDKSTSSYVHRALLTAATIHSTEVLMKEIDQIFIDYPNKKPGFYVPKIKTDHSNNVKIIEIAETADVIIKHIGFDDENQAMLY